MPFNSKALALVLVGLLAPVFAGCGKSSESTPAAGGGGAAKAADKQPDVAQAVPVWTLFKAVKDNDQKAFEGCWTKERAAELGKDWKNSFEEWSGEVKKILTAPDYKLEDFKWEYEGDDAKGKLYPVFKDKKLPKLSVAKDEGVWKISER